MLNHGSENNVVKHNMNLVYAREYVYDCLDRMDGLVVVDLTPIYNHFLIATKVETLFPKEVYELLFKFLMEYVSVWDGDFDYSIDNMDDELAVFVTLYSDVFDADVRDAFYQKDNWLRKNETTILRICKMYEEMLKEGVMCYTLLLAPYHWETSYDLKDTCLHTFIRLAEHKDKYDGL